MSTSSNPPPSSASAASSKNTILLTLGGAIALSIPATLSSIANPITRAGLELLALVVVFGIGIQSKNPWSKKP